MKNIIFILFTVTFYTHAIAQSEPKLAKNITLTYKGFKIDSIAVTDTLQNPINPNISIDASSPILIWCFIKSGFKVVKKKVYPGASRAVTIDKKYIKDYDIAGNFFKDGIKPNASKQLSIMVKLKDIIKNKSAITVAFSIWDLNSEAELKGTYTYTVKSL